MRPPRPRALTLTRRARSVMGRLKMKTDNAIDDIPSKKSAAAPPVAAKLALAILRVTLGAMFVWVYFENKGKGLYTPGGYAGLINYYVSQGSAPAFWKSIMSFMANHADVIAPV